LHATRQSGFSVNPITYQEIESFCRMTGAVIPPWEVSVIRQMDQAVLGAFNKTGGQKPQADEGDVEEQKLSLRGGKARRVVKRPPQSSGG
jgi:hypothetical protein